VASVNWQSKCLVKVHSDDVRTLRSRSEFVLSKFVSSYG
jgi:hypothetical protein